MPRHEHVVQVHVVAAGSRQADRVPGLFDPRLAHRRQRHDHARRRAAGERGELDHSADEGGGGASRLEAPAARNAQAVLLLAHLHARQVAPGRVGRGVGEELVAQARLGGGVDQPRADVAVRAHPARRGIGLGERHHDFQPLRQGAAATPGIGRNEDAEQPRRPELADEIRGEAAAFLEFLRAGLCLGGQGGKRAAQLLDGRSGSHAVFPFGLPPMLTACRGPVTIAQRNFAETSAQIWPKDPTHDARQPTDRALRCLQPRPAAVRLAAGRGSGRAAAESLRRVAPPGRERRARGDQGRDPRRGMARPRRHRRRAGPVRQGRAAGALRRGATDHQDRAATRLPVPRGAVGGRPGPCGPAGRVLPHRRRRQARDRGARPGPAAGAASHLVQPPRAGVARTVPGRPVPVSRRPGAARPLRRPRQRAVGPLRARDLVATLERDLQAVVDSQQFTATPCSASLKARRSPSRTPRAIPSG